MTSNDNTGAGLQVVASHEDDVPKQVYLDGSNLPESVSAKYDDKVVVAVTEPPSNAMNPYEGDHGEEDRVTCSMRRRTLLLVIAVLLLLIIVGAAVGGAVGGTQAAKNKSKSEQANATLSVTPTVSPTKATPLANSTTQSASSTVATILPTPASRGAWNLTVYRDKDYSGPSQNISNVGIYDLPFAVVSYGE